jgi:hypothetical protein
MVAEAGDSSDMGMSDAGSRYRATTSEDCNKLKTSSVSYSDLWSVQNSDRIILTCIYQLQEFNKSDY